jgi:hypothetical protein
MPKAQVLVTVTAEALVDVPAGVDDVEAFCREHVALSWGALPIESVVQPPAVTVEHYVVPEPEPEPEPVAVEAAVDAPAEVPVEAPAFEGARPSPEDTLPLPVAPITGTVDFSLVDLFNDPDYKSVIRSAVRARAERVLEEVVNQVVAELEPLLQRHINKNLHGAQ